MRVERKVIGLLICLVVATAGLVGCGDTPPEPVPEPEPMPEPEPDPDPVPVGQGGECCMFTGPQPHDCLAIESLGPGADLDGRCNQVNQGQSCAWNYSVPECCEIAASDGFGDPVICEPPQEATSGECCVFTGPLGADCAALENLGPGADLDGRCNQINQGQSCSWMYSIDTCCEKAVADGFGNVVCS